MKHFFSRCLFYFGGYVYVVEMQILESRRMFDRWRHKKKRLLSGIFAVLSMQVLALELPEFCIFIPWEVFNVQYFGQFKIIMAPRNCFLKKKKKYSKCHCWHVHKTSVSYCDMPWGVTWSRMTSRWCFGARRSDEGSRNWSRDGGGRWSLLVSKINTTSKSIGID